MKDNIIISIVTICYNSEGTIEDTLKSVLSQGYEKLDYVIIDGGSDDSTMRIVNKYREQLSYVCSEPDKGISDAFNKGIAHSSGEVICFINSDDIMLPGSLQRIAKEYDGHHDIYCGNVLLHNIETDFKCVERPSVKFPTMPFFRHVAHQGMFVTSEAYKRFGEYDVNVRFPMDLEFLMRAYRLGAVFKRIDYNIACFRSGGATSTDIRKKKKDYLYIVRKNGGNTIQSYIFYYYLVATQIAKKLINLFGGNLSQKLRYKSNL